MQSASRMASKKTVGQSLQCPPAHAQRSQVVRSRPVMLNAGDALAVDVEGLQRSVPIRLALEHVHNVGKLWAICLHRPARPWLPTQL
eukprot:11760930-Alexandrium_andersonii.AAC.1